MTSACAEAPSENTEVIAAKLSAPIVDRVTRLKVAPGHVGCRHVLMLEGRME